MNTHGVSDSVQTIQCDTVYIRNGANEMVTLPEYIRYKVNVGIEIKNKPQVIVEDTSESIPVIQNIWNVTNPKMVCIRYTKDESTVDKINVSIASIFMGEAQHYSTNPLPNNSFELKYYIMVDASTPLSDISATVH